MAERPKTAAERAEELGLLPNELTQTVSIAKLYDMVMNVRSTVNQMSSRLTWIVSSVRGAIGTTRFHELDQDLLDKAVDKLNDIEQQALQVYDVLQGGNVDYIDPEFTEEIYEEPIQEV